MPAYLRETNRYRMMMLISAVEYKEVYTYSIYIKKKIPEALTSSTHLHTSGYSTYWYFIQDVVLPSLKMPTFLQNR